MTTISERWLVRGGTAAAIAALNEIPLARELVLETDTGRLKRGDGVTHYNSLAYIGPGFLDVSGIADGDVLAWDAASLTFLPVAAGGGTSDILDIWYME